MNSPEQHPGAGVAGFPAAVPALPHRLAALRSVVGDSPEAETVLAELETAYEELRVADEEVHTQQEEIRRLAESQQQLRWQHQRMLEMLPVPVVITDMSGMVRSANAAAAGLLGIDLARLVRKPLMGFVALEDRAELRRQLPGLADGHRIRRMITVNGREGRLLTVEASATLGTADGRDITWIFLASSGGQAAMTTDIELPSALVQLASLPVGAVEVVEILRRATTVCQAALGDRVTVSLNYGPPNAPTAVSSSGQLAQAADGAQISLGEGPCITAFERRRTIVSTDLRTDDRWPRFAADPRTVAVGGVIAAPMLIGGELVGAVNVYGDVGDPPDGRLVETAELLAAGVAAVLYELSVREELELTATDMERALSSRATIDQAKGMIMADRGCTAEEAFQHLVELSSTQHVKLRDLARQIVDQRSATRSRRSDQVGGAGS
ncbi:ANTAR domain-containing protein [Nocardioides sp. URHA0020]|uniref:ANTAR domain-containing protein n=1 Tax=Nocardioides sp. URHA0020 TaxID=1380392 RepID=UPI000684EFDB|nr:ANTAR domain-containing protein [Nocardioides sp. URHA0020]